MSDLPKVLFEKPATLRTRVEDFLRSAIMEGRLQGGDRLREVELCEELGISRPTLREALRTLEAERLITIEPHRGPSVVRITPKVARDLYAVRALLEGHAAFEFANLATAEELNALDAAVRNLHAQATQGDKNALLTAKREFYEILLTGCRNDLIKELLTSLLSRVSLLRATSFAAPERLPASLAEIDALFDRIRARDAEGAQQAARDHIINAERSALAVLQELSSDADLQGKV